MKILFLFLVMVLFVQQADAQANVGIGTNSPHPNAILDIRSSNKGMLIPRLSTASRTAMSPVAKGLLVYDTTYSTFYYHDGGRWRSIHEENPDSLINDFINTPQVTDNMSDNGVTIANSGILYDNGGPSGNYAANSLHNYTVGNERRGIVRYQFGYKVVLEEFNTESPYDSLEIYPASDYSQRKVFTGNQTGTYIFPCGFDELQFRFQSNGVNQLSGFKIRWTKLLSDTTLNEQPPLYGWYFNPGRIAIRGGLNIENDWTTDSLGLFSFAYGGGNKVTGFNSVAWGASNQVRGTNSFASGRENNLNNQNTHAFGSFNTVTGSYAMAMGSGNTSAGDFSFTAGQGNQALARHSVAMGEQTVASDYNSISLGVSTTASGWGSVALGSYSTASGAAAFTAGSNNLSGAHYSGTIGLNNRATAQTSMAFNNGTLASGISSTAFGDSTLASGPGALAAGYKTTASGNYSTATGFITRATGQFGSFAAGYQSQANGTASFAANYGNIAGGYYSFATGQSNNVSGNVCTGIGFTNTVSGFASIAIGSHSTISGNWSNTLGNGFIIDGIYSTGIGTKMTIPAHASGAMGLGDFELSNNPVDNTVIDIPNQLVARFRGGYYFISTANAPGGTEVNRRGVKLDPGQNSWSAISDVRQKENFEEVDGETVLEKITKFHLSTWNYIGQDPKTFRHYGPMAQDFYNAFGKDKYGSIGCDTLINQQDFLGVSFIAIQALEKRTAAFRDEINLLKEQTEALRKENAILIKRLEATNK